MNYDWHLSSLIMNCMTSALQILQIFHRKVHPESTLTTKKSFKAIKQDSRENSSRDGGDHSGVINVDHTLTDSKRACKRRAIPCFKCDSSSPSLMVDGNDPNGTREYWIKTDADCKFSFTTTSFFFFKTWVLIWMVYSWSCSDWIFLF